MQNTLIYFILNRCRKSWVTLDSLTTKTLILQWGRREKKKYIYIYISWSNTFFFIYIYLMVFWYEVLSHNSMIKWLKKKKRFYNILKFSNLTFHKKNYLQKKKLTFLNFFLLHQFKRCLREKLQSPLILLWNHFQTFFFFSLSLNTELIWWCR